MNKHYLPLDAARGIAALAVMLYHFRKLVYPEVVMSNVPHLLQRSYLAVDLFFLMSGLVIARAYEPRLKTGAMSFSGFCVTRWIRLFPLYILGTLLGFAYALTKTHILSGESFTLAPESKRCC